MAQVEDWNAAVLNGIALSGTIVDGTTDVPVAGTAVVVTTSDIPIRGIWVSADLGNTNPIVVGASTVVAASGSMRGIVLIPGNPSIFIRIENLNLLWVDVQTSGDNLTWAYVSL